MRSNWLRISSFKFRAMKPFSFRLDSIRNYRNYLEKRAQGDLFNAKNEYMRKKEELKKLEEKRMETARICSDEGFKGIDVPHYQMFRSFVQKLDHDIERAHMSIKEGQQRVKVQEAVLKKESIKKKTLEVLRDLQLKRFLERLDREEQKAIDELAIPRKGERT